MIRKLSERLNKTQFAEVRLLSSVLLILAILMGIVVRWNFVSGPDFPLNDGGLFYSLIVDLVENNFRMPRLSSYNNAGIPNSYPPFAFYLVGGLKEITGISVLEWLRFLPFVISVLTLPVFYFLTKIFFPDNYFARAFSTYLFATLPRSFEWFVMGGGITRSLGFLFALAAIILYSKAAQEKKIGIELILAGIFGCLTVLSHPVAGLFLAFSVVVMAIYFKPAKLFHLILFGLIVVVGSSIWWGSVLKNNGISPFIGAADTGHADWLDLGYLITLNFNFENRFFLNAVSFLAILGLFSNQRRKSIFLGVLVGLGYLAVPRGGVDLLTSYLAILGTLGFISIINSWMRLETGLAQGDGFDWRSRVFLFCLVIYTFIGAYTYKFIDGKSELHLSNDEQVAMLWIRDNTDAKTRVLHLPPAADYHDWWNDYFGEWMPVFTERHSIATVQGYEWMPGEFGNRIKEYNSLRSCTGLGEKCVENWVITYLNDFDYLLISKRQQPIIVIDEYLDSPGYTLVYENEDAIVFYRNGTSN